jgi:hypothetical protein
MRTETLKGKVMDCPATGVINPQRSRTNINPNPTWTKPLFPHKAKRVD